MPLHITINAAHHSIYCDNPSLSGRHALTLNKVSYSIDFRPRWQVGRDGEMITKGYKQTLKTRRRLSFLSPISLYILLLFLTYSLEGSLGDSPFPVELMYRFIGGLDHSDTGWRSVDQFDPFHLEPVIS